MSEIPAWVADIVSSLPTLVTVPETSTVLRCTRRHVYRLIAIGELKSIRRDRARLIPRTAIIELLQRSAA